MADTPRYIQWRTYKPTKAKNGAASQLEIKSNQQSSSSANQLFWVIAQQTGLNDQGNATFGWNDTNKYITMKLEEIDVGKLLTVLNRICKETKLFHQNQNGNTSLSLTNASEKGYNLTIGRKRDDILLRISHSITLDEAEILKIALTTAVAAGYWTLPT